ncbi:MAG: hypothetical protein OEZ34_03200 [Spirochaetia bacterium]|nr:hypothetical protein [Spirochaetia bacterium]
MKYIFFIFASSLLISCKYGNPEIPGETQENPLILDISSIQTGKSDKIEKKFLKFKAVAATESYIYTTEHYDDDELYIEDDATAENFFFPIVPRNFNSQKDQIYVFGYMGKSTFLKLTENDTIVWGFDSPEIEMQGKLNRLLRTIDPLSIEQFRLPEEEDGYGFQIAPEDELITIKITHVNGEHFPRSILDEDGPDDYSYKDYINAFLLQID